MIEIGKKCTIYPDNQIEYEIVNVESKTIRIGMGSDTIEQIVYSVDLKEVGKSTRVSNISIHNINLVTE
ncbi:MAG: hypothetical protein ACK5M1_08650 [Xanthomarina gelatinilytica]|uniref:hypothetical protein n=1 Tax=Xanthomarina gelatinilytica TaxID=1137281 RepID=UPI003A87A63F